MLKKLTLDTNCLIDVAENQPNAAHVICLLKAFQTGEVDLAIATASASERQQDGSYVDSLNVFKSRMATLGFSAVPDVLPIATIGMWFVGGGIIADEKMIERKREIFETLFPGIAFRWKDFALSKGADPKDEGTSTYAKWRNRALDAAIFWSHENAGRDIFVTSDTNFRKLEGKPLFPTACIRTPFEALAHVGSAS